MQKRLALFAGSVLLLAGCTGQPARPPAQPPSLPVTASPQTEAAPAVPPTTTSTPTAAPAVVSDPASRLRRALDAWLPYNGDPGEDDWAVLDEEGRITLITHTPPPDQAERSDLYTQRMQWMFAIPEVDSVLSVNARRGYMMAARASLSRVERSTYESWHGQFPAPQDWPARADFYAARNRSLAEVVPVLYDRKTFHDGLTRWVASRVGDRLVGVQMQEPAEPFSQKGFPNRPSITVTVKAGKLTEQERIQEAGRILAQITLTYMASSDVVYEGVDRVNRLQSYELQGWATAGLPMEQLGDALTIDGKQANGVRGDSPRPGKREDLDRLLANRSRLQQLLPAGARLMIGASERQYGTLVVEAAVPQDQTWEQAWLTYEELTETLFTQAPEALDLLLILQRGQEVEFHYVWRAQWAPHRGLKQLIGEPLLPGMLPLGADLYDRYTVVKP